MIRTVKETTAFRRDIKRVQKRHKNIAKLYVIIETLVAGEPLDSKYHPHPLIGNWRACWECHIEPNWLLIYKIHEDYIELIRTGTHADLFE